MTLNAFFHTYAPAAEPISTNYATSVAKAIGCTVDTKIADPARWYSDFMNTKLLGFLRGLAVVLILAITDYIAQNIGASGLVSAVVATLFAALILPSSAIADSEGRALFAPKVLIGQQRSRGALCRGFAVKNAPRKSHERFGDFEQWNSSGSPQLFKGREDTNG
jgi:hypothetical protein